MRKAADATDCWPATTQRTMRKRQAADSRGPAGPPAVAAGFWLDDELQVKLGSWHMGKVIRAYRQHRTTAGAGSPKTWSRAGPASRKGS